MSEKLNALLELKKGIGQGSYGHQDILNVLAGFNENHKGNHFKEHLVEMVDPFSGDTVMVDGFTLTQDMPLSTARMLSQALRVSSGHFKFPVKIGFEKRDDGLVTMRMTTKDDFAPYLMDEPRNIAAINVQRMANYSVARALVNTLAQTNVYQFEPEMKYMPFPPDPETKPRGLLEGIDHYASTYMGTNRAVTKAMEERFTIRDVLEVKANFRDGLDTIKSILPSVKQMRDKPVKSAPESPEEPAFQHKARMRPGF